MGWLSFHSRLITGFTESFPERFGPRYLIDASHIVLYITTTPIQKSKIFFKLFFEDENLARPRGLMPRSFSSRPQGDCYRRARIEVTNALPMPSGNAVAEVFQ